MIKAAHAALASGAVVRALALDVVISAAASIVIRLRPPDKAAHAVHTVTVDDVGHALQRLAVVQALRYSLRQREAVFLGALDHA